MGSGDWPHVGSDAPRAKNQLSPNKSKIARSCSRDHICMSYMSISAQSHTQNPIPIPDSRRQAGASCQPARCLIPTPNSQLPVASWHVLTLIYVAFKWKAICLVLANNSVSGCLSQTASQDQPDRLISQSSSKCSFNTL